MELPEYNRRSIGWNTLNCVRVDDLNSERVAAIAIDYLLKPPVHLTHWSIPLCQHPSWDVKQGAGLPAICGQGRALAVALHPI